MKSEFSKWSEWVILSLAGEDNRITHCVIYDTLISSASVIGGSCDSLKLESVWFSITWKAISSGTVISVSRKRRGPKGDSEGKPQEDSKEILWKLSRAERHRHPSRTPARNQDSREIMRLLRIQRRRTPRGDTRW
jgi:hypothetical protein